MTTPSWLASQLDDRAHASAALTAAATQVNACKEIAARLNDQGRDHTTDPTWQAAARESHRLADMAACYGHDEYAIAAEAARCTGGDSR